MFRITPGPRSAAEDITQPFFLRPCQKSCRGSTEAQIPSTGVPTEKMLHFNSTQEGSLHPSKPTLCPAAGALQL